MKKLFLFFLLVGQRHGFSQPFVLIPDPNFKTYLQGLIPAAMNGSSLNISSTLVTVSTQTINVFGLGVSDLSGIQYFSSLLNLNCSTTSLTNLPSLPNSLQILDCSANPNLSSLPALPNSLVSLKCNALNLTSLPLLSTSLQTLICEQNNISALPNLPNSLTFLNYSSNPLTLLPTLPTSLTTLYHIAIPLSNLPSLPSTIQTLHCEYNNGYLSSLPSLPNSLKVLHCEFNILTSLPSLPNSLQILECQTNALSSLPTLPVSLQKLNCVSNLLTSLPSLPSFLEDLICDYNSLNILPTLPSSLKVLSCGNNKIKCFPYFPSSLLGWSIDDNPYNCLPNYVLPIMNTHTNIPLCAAGNSNICPLGIVSIEKKVVLQNDLSFSPNPTDGQFVIETSGSDTLLVRLFDLNGNLLLEEKKSDIIEIDVTTLQAGVYNMVINCEGYLLTKKLVVFH